MKRITNEEMMREIRCTDKNSMGKTTFESANITGFSQELWRRKKPMYNSADIICRDKVCPRCSRGGILMKADGTEHYCPSCHSYFKVAKLKEESNE